MIIRTKNLKCEHCDSFLFQRIVSDWFECNCGRTIRNTNDLYWLAAALKIVETTINKDSQPKD